MMALTVDDGSVGRRSGVREVERHRGNLLWALELAERELGTTPRQAFNKVFLAWREAIAYIAARLLADLRLSKVVRDQLSRLPTPAYEDGEVRVTTSNAVKTLKTLLRVCSEAGCGRRVVEALRLLWEVRDTAFKLHTAFYEGPEHAGFEDEMEAVEATGRLLEKIRRLVETL
ncbi:hypothetical protein [Pyrolobus fumarii]|nr:hypothetical protein [Pyrolobus fumarii]